MKKVEKNKVEGNYLMVGIEKNIWYGSIKVESKAEILEKILPEYVGLKRVREVVARVKKAENKKQKQEVLITYKDGKTYSICEVDGKPTLVEATTTLEDVKRQIVSIVSEYIQADEMDEFLANYLETVAEYTVYADDVEAVREALVRALKTLRVSEVFDNNDVAGKLIDDNIKSCQKITVSYDSVKQVNRAVTDISAMIRDIATIREKHTLREREYSEVKDFIEQVRTAVSNMTVCKSDFKALNHAVNDLCNYVRDYISVVPDYIPENFEYLDGSVEEHNFRIIRKRDHRWGNEEFIMTWISRRTLQNGIVVNGFFTSYEIDNNAPYMPKSNTNHAEIRLQYMHFYYDKSCVGEWDVEFDKEHYFRQFKWISKNQYQSINEWCIELGYTVIELEETYILDFGDCVIDTSDLWNQDVDVVYIEENKVCSRNENITNRERLATYWVI